MENHNLTSYCGLDCTACGAYVATVNRDEPLRRAVAKRWSGLYGREINPEDVLCLGCKSPGPKGVWCASMCRIKPCCRQKGIPNCGMCGDLPCRDLKAVFDFDRDAEQRLAGWNETGPD